MLIWVGIAASSGSGIALKNSDIIAKQMTPADISKLQDLARDCVRKRYKEC